MSSERWSVAWLGPIRAVVLGGLTLAAFASAVAGAGGMRIRSAAFEEGQPIPRPYTCEGRDVSPPLAWDGMPAGAKSLVLTVDDPDAPDPAAPRVTWVHWVLYNLPASAGGLPKAVAAGALPQGTLQGINDWGRAGYGGPCPPVGRHRYFSSSTPSTPCCPT